jgi:hypothetical protein
VTDSAQSRYERATRAERERIAEIRLRERILAEQADRIAEDATEIARLREHLRDWQLLAGDRWAVIEQQADRIAALERENARLREARNAGLLLRADIQCCNGCDCEFADYCAADRWDAAVIKAGVGASSEDGEETAQ